MRIRNCLIFSPEVPRMNSATARSIRRTRKDTLITTAAFPRRPSVEVQVRMRIFSSRHLPTAAHVTFDPSRAVWHYVKQQLAFEKNRCSFTGRARKKSETRDSTRCNRLSIKFFTFDSPWNRSGLQWLRKCEKFSASSKRRTANVRFSQYKPKTDASELLLSHFEFSDRMVLNAKQNCCRLCDLERQ
jgi:hypothetical protein